MTDTCEKTHGAGRPPFKTTPKLRKAVERMRACGDSHDTIARAIGIDDDTLRKHFDDELKNGYAKRRREVVDAIFDGVKAGNATLIKRAEEMTRLAGALQDFDRPAAEQKLIPAKKLPKKEAVRQDAIAAGTDNEWGEDLKAPLDLPN